MGWEARPPGSVPVTGRDLIEVTSTFPECTVRQWRRERARPSACAGESCVQLDRERATSSVVVHQSCNVSSASGRFATSQASRPPRYQ